MCVYPYADGSGGYMHWSIDTSRASTDERIHFTLLGAGGACSASGNYNDYQQSSGNLYVFCDTPLEGVSY